MKANSADPRYWSATITEGYYTCSDTADPTNLCKNAAETYYGEQTESTYDWIAPYTDTDRPEKNEAKGLFMPWCTPASTIG